MQSPCVFVSIKCWTCKWYFTLSLLACMSRCSFLVWMFIVITIYSDCSCLVMLCFIDLIFTTWLHCASPICISRFLLTMIILCYFFSGKTCSCGLRASRVLELGVSGFWQLFLTHMLSLKSVLGFCHGIVKGRDCKVEFIQSYVGFILCKIFL